mmetsp:Transcript_123527/g.395126  ORF Transcript_123527/g.395126 Transcript_123527/m.395126 type:complete len:2722 (+) Transcript_123527:112-8277(+)
MSLQTSDYLVIPQVCANPKVRLVCFPHSGGGPSSFANWPEQLDAERIEVVAISPPGRERRVDAAPITDWKELVSEICEALKSSGLIDDLPYAFFGHSLGALMAYETARRLDAELVPGRPRPIHLFASAHGAPSTAPAAGNNVDWDKLAKKNDQDLIEAVQIFGFLPNDLAQNDGLMMAILPALRADFHLYETYVPELGRATTQLPITAMGGFGDQSFPPSMLSSWGEECAALRGPELFDGDHFYTETCRPAVLRMVADHVEASLSTLPASIHPSNFPASPQAQTRLMVDVIFEVAKGCQDEDAIVDDFERVSYAQLVRRVQLLAGRLSVDLKCMGGQVVGLLMSHDATYIIAMLAIWRAAGILLVVEAHFPPSLCKEICEGCSMKAAITVPEHAAKFADVDGCVALVLEGNFWSSFAPESRVAAETLPTPGLEDPCMLMMTSGTTGRPKQIAGSHRFIHIGHLAKNQVLPYTDDDKREAFNVMFVWEAIRPLMFGLTSFVLSDGAVLDPQLFVACLQKHKCSRVLTTPSLLATIMQHCAREMGNSLGLMRTWWMCGEVLPMKIVSAFRGIMPSCKLVNDYSSWESGDVAYAIVSPEPQYEPSQVFAAAGMLAPGVMAVIIDPETKKVLPRGVPGELFVGGTALSSGYWQQPEVTAERFVQGFVPEMKALWAGVWYKTGDLGRFIGEPPVLEIRGRIDSTVKIRGFKVGIPVVESAIAAVAGVALCAVVPVYESPAVVDSLLCFIETQEGFKFDQVVQVVKKEAVKTIPRWMLPAYFRPMPENVRSGGESRKLDRKKLNGLADLTALKESQAAAADKAASETTAGRSTAASEVSQDDGIRGILRTVWAKALNLNIHALDLEENFFDLGGHSTLAAKMAGELSDQYGLAVTVLDIYSHSSLGALMDYLDAQGASTAGKSKIGDRRGLPRGRAGGAADGIAVVGIAGRFPGAVDTESFWENLRQGAVSATFLSKDFLRSKGVPEQAINHKDFVAAAYMINDVDKFDHQFFGIGRHEASMMDPQHRLFIEASYAAIENAALSPKTGLSDSVVGVFAAAGIDGYLIHHLDGMPLKDGMDPQDIFLAEIGNEKDYIATRVSYLMDFTGPSMNVNSACSSALVAIVQGAASITAGQCDAAIAGGSSITFPNLGYLYSEGLVSSVDGYVRPFDTGADGTVFGDAVVSVLLRRKEDAVGGLSWGTLRGFAVSNDGGSKAGYAAPSPTGQSQAIMSAMQMMGEDPWSISYVECHATGTRVGDGIEVRGLISSFNKIGGAKGPNEAFVALGSVKGNISHANCAAGATGFVKTLMMMRSKELVPTANFKTLNPKVNLDGTPFAVNGELCAWQLPAGKAMRAGVSSFGIGGTNAHTILEATDEPAQKTAESASLPFQLLPFSGKTASALRRSAEQMIDGFKKVDGRTSIASAAYTLQSGRAALQLRKAMVLPAGSEHDIKAVADVLQKEFPDEEELEEIEDAAKKPTVAFVFPGQGSQYFGMARGLYDQVPLFRSSADRCCELLMAPEHLGFDLRPTIFSSDAATEKEREKKFAQPTITQPSLFVVEYSLAQVLLAVGIAPVAVAGHSLGEYVAAIAGGLLSLESAVGIVAVRAKSTETLAEDGAMLSVSEWSEEELASISNGDRKGLWLAAVNSPLHAVISGEVDAVNALDAELKAAGRKCAKLHVQKAFHSGLIAKAANTLTGLGMPVEKAEAVIPVASNQSGSWLNAATLRGGTYWTDHMRGTVHWRQNAEKIMSQWQPAAFLEVGPGNALSVLTAKCVSGDNKPIFIQAMRHPKAVGTHDVEALLGALGRLWEAGYNIDWPTLHSKVLGQEQLPVQLRLPTYAFDRTSLWANPERSVYVEVTEDPAPAAYSKTKAATASAMNGVLAMSGIAPKALLRFGETRSAEAAIKAYCLPFASGSATLFAPWAQQADDVVEVIAIELPGRGGRSEERIPQNDQEDEVLLGALCDAILADLRGSQYVLVGFSMGGGLTVELALRLAARQAAPPLALYVAGRKPPAMDPASVGDITMTNEEIAQYAFAPPEVAQSDEFLQHVVPLLRSDLGVDVRAERRLSAAQLAGKRMPHGVGFEVYCGASDDVAPWADAPGWQRFVAAQIGINYFPGGHEFMQEMRSMIHASWRRDAIGRLVQRRSAELALLSAQGFAAPGAAPAVLAWAGAGAASSSEKGPPLYAVRWVPSVPAEAAPAEASHAVVDLGHELGLEQLDAARAAVQGKSSIFAICAPTAGVLGGRAEATQVEVRQCWQFARLVQHLTEAGLSAHIVAVCPAAASGAMVAGASKAVAMEAAELRIQRVYVPSDCLADVAKNARDISALVSRYPQETDLWVQGAALKSKVFSPRIEPFTPPSVKVQCLPKKTSTGEDAVYVLTGATGGLGSAVVEWMVREQGLAPTQLVLLRRSGSTALSGVLAACRVVEVSKPDSMEAILASGLRDLQQVIGIFHLAGVLDDGILSGMTEERFLKVAQPKCSMLTALMHAVVTFQWSVQWIIAFSSTSSLFGYAGQSNYCAANAMLDNLAAFGSAGVLPEGDRPPCRVLAINWGPWGEAGMAKVGSKAYAQAVAEGDTPLSTSSALQCLAAALRVAGQAQPAAVQFCACDVDWRKSQWNGLPILELVHDSAPPEAEPEAAAGNKVGSESGGKRVENFLLQHTKSGTSWKKIQGKSLHLLGLDSLEIVQIRNFFNKQFGVNVPLSLIADPSVKLSALVPALCEYLDA